MYLQFKLILCFRYCVEFEILKASKACRKEKLYSALREGKFSPIFIFTPISKEHIFSGERVCVRCESQALRKYLDWRCQGHGVEGRSTRWSALSAPHCHGKWLRVQHDPSLNQQPATDGKPLFAFEHQPKCSTKTCSKEGGPAFIFV